MDHIEQRPNRYFLTDTTRLWLREQCIGKSSQLSKTEVHKEWWLSRCKKDVQPDFFLLYFSLGVRLKGARKDVSYLTISVGGTPGSPQQWGPAIHLWVLWWGDCCAPTTSTMAFTPTSVYIRLAGMWLDFELHVCEESAFLCQTRCGLGKASLRVTHKERRKAERRGMLAPRALDECLLSCRTHTSTLGWPSEGSVKTTILGKIHRGLSFYNLSFQVTAMPSAPWERRREARNYVITFWGIIEHRTGPRKVYSMTPAGVAHSRRVWKNHNTRCLIKDGIFPVFGGLRRTQRGTQIPPRCPYVGELRVTEHRNYATSRWSLGPAKGHPTQEMDWVI